MTVEELAHALSLRVLAGEAGLKRQVTGCYIGDLLSWVMGRAKEGDAWLTVMGNLNAVGVAALADTACIVLVENAWLDEDAQKRAGLEGIPVLATDQTSYALALRIAAMLP
jgi:predicted transcriptional regulator